VNPNTLHKISYGLYIVASKDKKNNLNAQIANAVFQVTAKPQTIAVSINKENLTHQYILESNVFSLSVLTTDATMPFIGKFGFKTGKNIDKFKETDYILGSTKAPIVKDYALAWMEAEVIKSVPVGTHTIFIAEIKDAQILDEEAEPMTYDYYHRVKGGFSPKTAPTYVEHLDKKMEAKKMTRYVCKVCGYVYDPDEGDSDSGIKPGTKFEDLPDDWVCPVCGAGKDEFEAE